MYIQQENGNSAAQRAKKKVFLMYVFIQGIENFFALYLRNKATS